MPDPSTTTEEAPASEDAEALLLDLEVWLQGALDIAARLFELRPGRYMSTVWERLDEAQMWLERGERR